MNQKKDYESIKELEDKKTSNSQKTDLLKIPGVGRDMKQHLIHLGFTNVESLKNASPEQMYEKDKQIHNGSLDRCVLYVYRCAVEFANTRNPNLKWWDFKDQ